MQLKIQRSQRDSGVISKTAMFCLDARVEFTAEERRHISRYKLGKEVIYSSEAAKLHAAKGDANVGAGTLGNIKAIGSFVMARLNLNISIESLERGQHVECKSLEELLGAEDAIMTACKNLKSYLATAATFDGREVLFKFDADEPEAIAIAVSPSPAAIVEASPRAVPGPAPTSQATSGNASSVAPQADWEGHETVAIAATDASTEYYEGMPAPGFGSSDETTQMVLVGGGIILAILVAFILPLSILMRAIILAALGYAGHRFYKGGR